VGSRSVYRHRPLGSEDAGARHYGDVSNDPLVLDIPYADPLALFAQVAADPYAALLHSALADARGRHSFIAVDPFKVLVCREGEVEVDGVRVPGAPFDVVRAELARHPQAAVPGAGPFCGGAVGYLGYEMARHLERIPRPPAGDMDVPEMQLLFCDVVIAFDHLERRAQVISTGHPEPAGDARRVRALERLRAAAVRFSLPVAPASPARPAAAPRVSSDIPREAHELAVRRVVDYILAGDVFQVNLSRRLRCDLPEGLSPLDLFGRLCAGNPAPFAAYLKLDDLVIASSSPERFVRLSGDVVETRPIKGTRPRGRGPAEDDALAAELAASDKDRAENVMIVDLLRNDLSRVCRDGSVAVPELCSLERYATVMHLVSSVTGRLRPGLGPVDLLAACFPGGSITGAPKIRAMEIIAELEPTRRGAYCGAIGYLGFDGAMDTSIVIRTFTIRGRRVSFQVGGGVVAASTPEGEYDETLAKAAALIGALSP
jgi:para-aminobenzoate synthetase component 1